jgi:hypothetical protein
MTRDALIQRYKVYAPAPVRPAKARKDHRAGQPQENTGPALRAALIALRGLAPPR